MRRSVLYSEPGLSLSRSLTPIAQWMSTSRHTEISRSTSGPGTSTDSAHMRSHSSSWPPKPAASLAHAFDG
jgi:hypothetical protein